MRARSPLRKPNGTKYNINRMHCMGLDAAPVEPASNLTSCAECLGILGYDMVSQKYTNLSYKIAAPNMLSQEECLDILGWTEASTEPGVNASEMPNHDKCLEILG